MGRNFNSNLTYNDGKIKKRKSLHSTITPMLKPSCVTFCKANSICSDRNRDSVKRYLTF